MILLTYEVFCYINYGAFYPVSNIRLKTRIMAINYPGANYQNKIPVLILPPNMLSLKIDKEIIISNIRSYLIDTYNIFGYLKFEIGRASCRERV